jgi:hypothetical protein
LDAYDTGQSTSGLNVVLKQFDRRKLDFTMDFKRDDDPIVSIHLPHPLQTLTIENAVENGELMIPK